MSGHCHAQLPSEQDSLRLSGHLSGRAIGLDRNRRCWWILPAAQPLRKRPADSRQTISAVPLPLFSQRVRQPCRPVAQPFPEAGPLPAAEQREVLPEQRMVVLPAFCVRQATIRCFVAFACLPNHWPCLSPILYWCCTVYRHNLSKRGLSRLLLLFEGGPFWKLRPSSFHSQQRKAARAFSPDRFRFQGARGDKESSAIRTQAPAVLMRVSTRQKTALQKRTFWSVPLLLRSKAFAWDRRAPEARHQPFFWSPGGLRASSPVSSRKHRTLAGAFRFAGPVWPRVLRTCIRPGVLRPFCNS